MGSGVRGLRLRVWGLGFIIQWALVPQYRLYQGIYKTMREAPISTLKGP